MGEVKHTPGPWEFVPGTEHHGPYVAGPWAGDICDCYTMSNPMHASVRNGGDSRPIWFHGETANANAALIAQAPTMFETLERIVGDAVMLRKAIEAGDPQNEIDLRVSDIEAAALAALSKANPSPEGGGR